MSTPRDPAQRQETRGQEWARGAVPHDQRLGFWGMFYVWWGMAFALTSLIAGGAYSELGSLRVLVPLIVIGNAVAATVSAIMSIVGSRTGYSTAMLCRYGFGRYGMALPSIIFGGIMVGWLGVLAGALAEALVALFRLPSSYVAYISFAAAVIMGLPAVIGIKWIRNVAYVSVPATIIVLGYATITGIDAGGGLAYLFSTERSAPAAFPLLMHIAISSWMGTAVASADMSRFAKRGIHGAVSSGTALLVVSSWLMAAGAISAVGIKNPNLFGWLGAQPVTGMLVLAFVGLVAGSWAAAAAVAYSASLYWSGISARVPRWGAVVFALLLGGLLAATGIALRVVPWLAVIGMIAPPVFGVVIADFWLLRGRPVYKREPSREVHYPGVVAWIAGFIVAYSTMSGPGIAALNSIIVTIALYVALSWGLDRRVAKAATLG